METCRAWEDTDLETGVFQTEIFVMITCLWVFSWDLALPGSRVDQLGPAVKDICVSCLFCFVFFLAESGLGCGT